MRQIDADAVLVEVKKAAGFSDRRGQLAHAISCIENAPTIEAVPVRHGRWQGWTTSRWTGKYKDYDEPEFKDYTYYTCSECYRKSVVRELYCPQCGAKMDG